jgi:hypothetical protein
MLMYQVDSASSGSTKIMQVDKLAMIALINSTDLLLILKIIQCMEEQIISVEAVPPISWKKLVIKE